MNQYSNRIIQNIKRQESHLLKSVSWISLGIAVLYMLGYAWRFCFYTRMGVPIDMVDFPFPDILIPKRPVLIVLVNAFVLIASEKYFSFFVKKRREYRSRSMDIDAPLDQLQFYITKKNFNNPEQTNLNVLFNYLSNYITENSEKSGWKFFRSEFDEKAKDLFPDVPMELRESLISYAIQLIISDDAEKADIIGDAIGCGPNDSKVYRNVQFVFFILYSCSIIGAFFWSPLRDIFLYMVYALIGVSVGYYIVKVSSVEARWQMWHSVMIVFVVILAINGFDGYITADRSLKGDRATLVKIVEKGGIEHEGFLLSSLNDGYVILELKSLDSYPRLKIHKQAVNTICWREISKEKYLKEVFEKKEEDLAKCVNTN